MQPFKTMQADASSPNGCTGPPPLSRDIKIVPLHRSPIPFFLPFLITQQTSTSRRSVLALHARFGPSA